MKPNWSNVFIISLGLVLTATTGLALYLAHSHQYSLETKSSYMIEIPHQWIEIDLTELEPLKKIYAQKVANEFFNHLLVETCRDQEKYVFRFDTQPGRNFGTTVSVEIDSDDALVNIQHNRIEVDSDKNPIKIDTTFFRTNKDNLKDVFFLLQNMPVWNSNPTQYGLCYESPRFYFEACNDGRYAARNHGCSFERESNQILKLFEQKQQLLGK